MASNHQFFEVSVWRQTLSFDHLQESVHQTFRFSNEMGISS